MTAAFRATYADWKLVKTRAVVQVVFEVPLADADAAYDVLGGMPNAAKEGWFGIAALVAGAGTPTASPLMAVENEKGARNPGGYHEVANPNGKKEREEIGRDEPAPARSRKRYWRDIPPAQQAGIRRNDPVFVAFLKEQRASDWREASDAVECVRLICGVQSCKELGSDHRARVIWHQLDEQFQAWAALEHAS